MSSGPAAAAANANTGLYRNFIANASQYSPNVSDGDEAVLRLFDEFLARLLSGIPGDGEPQNKYGFNSHMGECVRGLHRVYSEYNAARTCFHVRPLP